MRHEVKIDCFGDALGFTLPEGLIRDLDLNEGDSLVFRVNSAGQVDVSKAPDPDLAEKMRLAGESMERYAETLCKLADS